MKVRPIIAWYDLWVGAFWDAKKRWLYVLPFPCVGIVIKFPLAPGIYALDIKATPDTEENG